MDRAQMVAAELNLAHVVRVGPAGGLRDAVVEVEQELLESQGILRLGATVLVRRDNTVKTPEGEVAVQPSTATLFEALMRKYPDAVSRESLQTEVVRFAPDAQSGAVHTRVYQLRGALCSIHADISVEFVKGRGYRLVMR
jgi:DNA-binding winged helix-turn-helix (wHTH) protein